MSKNNAPNHSPCASKAPEALQNADDSEAPPGPARAPPLKNNTTVSPSSRKIDSEIDSEWQGDLRGERQEKKVVESGMKHERPTPAAELTTSLDSSDEEPTAGDDGGDDEDEKDEVKPKGRKTKRGKPNPRTSREIKIASGNFKSKKANLIMLATIKSRADREAAIARKEADDMEQRRSEVYAAYEDKLSDRDRALLRLEMARFSPEVQKKQETINSLEARVAYLEYLLKKAKKKKDKAENNSSMFVRLQVPETKGLALEEIDLTFGDSSGTVTTNRERMTEIS
ncbi:hypothetical protein FRC09_003481 [Ceratobasidium sp. 395]|nr:hypothetical protein FRC09_003481 [Ceratobasidium sp. 395]